LILSTDQLQKTCTRKIPTPIQSDKLQKDTTMKTYSTTLIIALATFVFAACNNDTPIENEQTATRASVATEITAAEAAMKALQIMPGTVDNIVKVDGTNGASVWKVTVSMSKEWSLDAKLDAASGGLLEVHGGFSPENFNFAPGAYFVPLSTISSVVQRDLGAEIISWKFEHDSAHNEWVYDLDIRKADGSKESITMSAVSRRVLSGNAV
jgi:uncharacterized membrane protein YkoI